MESRRFTAHSRARSFVFAWRGLSRFVATQHNAWIHMAATIAIILVCALLNISIEDWRWIVLAIGLVWIAEALNTAVEQLGDAVSLEQNERIGFAKDVAAGGALVSAITAAMIGALTLLPYFARLP